MNSLDQLNILFTEEGLTKFIFNFRNPQLSAHFTENVTFNSLEDCRIYEYDEDDQRFNPFNDGKEIVTLQKAFQNSLTTLINKLEAEISAASPIIAEDASYREELLQCLRIDFNKLQLLVSQLTESVELKKCLSGYIRKFQSTIVTLRQKILNHEVKTASQNSKNSKHKNHQELVFKGDANTLRKIYHSLNLEAGAFINRDLTSESTFIKIFISEPNRLESEIIQFNCETKQAAYILKKIFPHHQNLWVKIEKSKRFLSKNGKFLTAVNLSKSFNDAKGVKEKDIIDTFFSKLLNG